MSKHEEVVEKFLNYKLNYVSDKEEMLKILESAYGFTTSEPAFPQPELRKGMWVDSNRTPGKILMFLNKTGTYSSFCLLVDGSKPTHDFDPLTPHTFVESDLSLLNTDEVRYSVFHARYDSCFYVEGRYKYKKSNRVLAVTKVFPTAHEAIESIFTQTALLNHSRKSLGLDNG